MAARFQVGQRCARATSIPWATRACRDTRAAKVGTIERDHGVFVFPDTNAHFLGEKPQHVYSVRFAARELWGEQAAPQIPSTSTCGTTTLSRPEFDAQT